MVDGSQKVLMVTVEGKPCNCLWSLPLIRLISGLAMVFTSPLNTVTTDGRCGNGWRVC